MLSDATNAQVSYLSFDDASKPLAFRTSPAATPVSPSSTDMQTQALAPSSILSFGSAHLSVLPDASGLTISDGSSSRLKDGETAEIASNSGLALHISRSGAVYLVQTRTADTTRQLPRTSSNGASDLARSREQSAGEDISVMPGGTQVSVSTATGGPTDYTAGEVSTGGAALVCPSDIRDLVAGMLMLVMICSIVE